MPDGAGRNANDADLLGARADACVIEAVETKGPRPAGSLLHRMRAPWGADQAVRRTTYAVLRQNGPPSPAEKRTGSRRRTRLRSGKLAGFDGQFIVECLLYDRSPEGLRLRLVRNVPLPTQLCVYEDDSQDLWSAHLIWRRGQEIGVRLLPRHAPGALRDQSALGRKFYAVTD